MLNVCVTHSVYAPAGARPLKPIAATDRCFRRSYDLWPSSHWLVCVCGSPSCKCTHNLKYIQTSKHVSVWQHMTRIDHVIQLVLSV